VHNITFYDEKYDVSVVTALCNQPKAFALDLGDVQLCYLFIIINSCYSATAYLILHLHVGYVNMCLAACTVTVDVMLVY